MKAFTLMLCFAFVTMGLLGVTGCGADNESEGAKASKKLGDPGKADLSEVKPAGDGPKTNSERTAPSNSGGDSYKNKVGGGAAKTKK